MTESTKSTIVITNTNSGAQQATSFQRTAVSDGATAGRAFGAAVYSGRNASVAAVTPSGHVVRSWTSGR